MLLRVFCYQKKCKVLRVKVLDKKYKEKGALFVLFALLLPVILLFAGLAIDVGMLYLERTRLQGVADSAALAGATERYQSDLKNVQLPSASSNTVEATQKASATIKERVLEYIQLNGEALGIVASDSGSGEMAIQFTNFTADDEQIKSRIDAEGNIVYENLAGVKTNYKVDVYTGPRLADSADNTGKVAVQCGVPVDHTDRVRVRIQKRVPVYFLKMFMPSYSNGVPILVTSASAARPPMSKFRIAALHGLYVNNTSIGNSELNIAQPNSYLEGDVYAGDVLAVLAGSNAKQAAYDGCNDGTKGNKYSRNAMVVKGKIYTRQISNGTPDIIDKYQDKKGTVTDAGLFYQLAISSNRKEYLYNRYNPDKGTYEYALESQINGYGEDERYPWRHVYNFDRIGKIARVMIWEESLGHFMPFPQHLVRLGVAPEKDRQAFVEATKSVMGLRSRYRLMLNSLYWQAKRELENNPDTTKWRYLKASTMANANSPEVCNIKTTDTEINLLVEIDGVDTTFVSNDYNYTTHDAVAFLNGENLHDGLVINQMVVVIKDPGEKESDPYHNGLYYNDKTALRTKTGALCIKTGITGTDAEAEKNNKAQAVTFGDIYSEANISIQGKSNIFNGVIFSEKNIVVPYAYYGSKGLLPGNRSSHTFGSNCSMLANRISFGYTYCVDGITTITNEKDDRLTAGMDYPNSVIVKRRHVINNNGNGKHADLKPATDSDIPMHYVLAGLSDEDYHAAIMETDLNPDVTDDIDTGHLKMKTYENEYSYHWFNPNGKLSYVAINTEEEYKDTSLHTYYDDISSDNTKGVPKLDNPAYRLTGLLRYSSPADTSPKDVYGYKFHNASHNIFINDTDKATKSSREIFIYNARDRYNNDEDRPLKEFDDDWYKNYWYGWPIDTDYSSVNGNRFKLYDKPHYVAYFKNDYETGEHFEIHPLTSLTSEKTSEDYLYSASYYYDESLRKNNQLFNKSHAMLDFPVYFNSTDLNVADNAIFTPFFDGKPWLRYNDDNNKKTFGRTSDFYHSKELRPWYSYIAHIGGKQSAASTTLDNADVLTNMTIANSVYLSFWRRAALKTTRTTGFEDLYDPRGVRDPFEYCEDPVQRQRIVDMVNVGSIDPTVRDDCDQYLDTDLTTAKREAKSYRATVDIDMCIKYFIDDWGRFPMMENGTSGGNKWSFSDGYSPRYYDEATDTEHTDGFGKYPQRAEGATALKENEMCMHTFGAPEGTVYASISIVE